MVYGKLMIDEGLIIFTYAVSPTILSLFLTLLDLNFGVILSIVKLVVFLRMVHNEDQRTGMMYFRFVVTKLLSALCVYFLMDYIAEVLKEYYLPPGYLPGSADGSGGGTVKVPKSKARALLTAKKSNDLNTMAKFVGTRVLVEYLATTGDVAHYRITFLTLVLIVFGVLQVTIWYFFPARTLNDEDTNYPTSGDEQQSDNKKSQ